MCGRFDLWRLLSLALVITLVFTVAAVGQSSQPFIIQTIPVGLKPLGVHSIWAGGSGGVASCFGRRSPTAECRVWAAVANSGDNSVSVFEFPPDLEALPHEVYRNMKLLAVIRDIPSPYAVVSCGPGFLVTSPSANSVSLISVSTETVVGTATVGPQALRDCPDSR